MASKRKRNFLERNDVMVTKLAVYGDGKSVRSEISLIMHNGLVYIETSDNESGANNRRAKINLAPNVCDCSAKP